MTDLTENSSTAFSKDVLLRAAGTVVKQLLRSPDWDKNLQETVGTVGSVLRVSTCYILENRRQEGGGFSFVPRATWISPEFSPACDQSIDGVIELDGWSYEHWQSSRPVRQVLLDGDPDFPDAVRSTPQFSGASAVALAPIVVGEILWGFLSVASYENDRSWTSTDLDVLELVSSALGSTVERHQLEYERARVSAIVSNSDDAIIGKTLDGVITLWNESAERLYGYTADEVIGQHITIIIPSSRHDEFVSIMKRLINGERVEHHETIRVRKDGERVAVSVSITPVRDYAGTITGAVTVARDVTARKRAELDMLASEERSRLALEAGNVGTWDWLIDSDEVRWSENMESLHGLEPGSFKGTFADFKRGVHPDDHHLITSAIQRAMDDDEEYLLEYRSIMPDGSVQWRGTKGQVLRDEQGQPRRMVGVCFDITERKRAEMKQSELLAQIRDAHAEAEAERNRLQELFQHAPAMMALLEGPDHVFTLANEHYRRAIGYREVLGKTVSDALPELLDQGILELLNEVYTTASTVTRSELRLFVDLQGDGTLEERFFTFAYQPTRNADGHVTGVLVHAIDLSDHVQARRRVEELAQASAAERDRLQQIIDVLPEGISITDETGAFILANAAAMDIWGQPAPEGDYRNYTAFECYHPDGTPVPVEELPLARSILAGETVRGVQLLIRNDKSRDLIPVLVNSAPLWGAGGALAGAVAVFQDITPLKEFEQEKDEFLQAVSHDLKNPLTTIRGYAQMLPNLSDRDPERYRLAASNMEAASSRAIALLDEILDLTRLQMGRPLDLKMSQIDLVPLTNRLAEQHQATTSLHEIQVVSAEPSVIGEWDQVRLERVLGNLLANAITYSPDGGRVEVMISTDEADNPDQAVIHVRDEGMGIPSQDMPRLFQRFWRGSNVRDTVRGTGLGLAGAKAIIDAHGGEITVESVEDEGSTFTVRLPIRPAEATGEE